MLAGAFMLTLDEDIMITNVQQIRQYKVVSTMFVRQLLQANNVDHNRPNKLLHGRNLPRQLARGGRALKGMRPLSLPNETPPAGTHERNHNGTSETNRRRFAGKFTKPDPHEKAEKPANKDREWKTMRLTNDASSVM